MRVSSQYTLAVHSLVMIEFLKEERVTSEIIANAAGCNPVIVRNVFSKLRVAGLLDTSPGRGKAELSRPADEITLADVYIATETDDVDEIFKMYSGNTECPMGRCMHELLNPFLTEAKDAMLDSLKRTTIADLVAKVPGLTCDASKKDDC